MRLAHSLPHFSLFLSVVRESYKCTQGWLWRQFISTKHNTAQHNTMETETELHKQEHMECVQALNPPPWTNLW